MKKDNEDIKSIDERFVDWLRASHPPTLASWLKGKAEEKKRQAEENYQKSIEREKDEEKIQLRAYELWQAAQADSGKLLYSRRYYEDKVRKELEVLKELEALKGKKELKLNFVQKVLSSLNKPLIFLEKNCWEPIDKWLNRAAIFQIFEKFSPILEAVGVILIPFIILSSTLFYENARDERERKFRQQEAIKNYLNQITIVFLDGNIRVNEDLQLVVEASTLTLFRDPNLDSDGRRRVIKHLSKLMLINGERENGQIKEPVISLRDVYLSEAHLRDANLYYANLEAAILYNADLRSANLEGANLEGANLNAAYLNDVYLNGANLEGAYLNGANLSGAYLNGAYLNGAYLFSAHLGGANLINTENLTPSQIKSACFWEEAIYKGSWDDTKEEWIFDKKANLEYIEQLKQDKSSDPEQEPYCSKWE